MGVDFLFCDNCHNCLHEDCFNVCAFCFEKDKCDDCEERIHINNILEQFKDEYDKDLVDENNKIYVCDDCLKKTDEYEPELCDNEKCLLEADNTFINLKVCKEHYKKIKAILKKK